MTKDLVRTLISEYQMYVTGVDFIPREVEFQDVHHLLIITKDEEDSLEYNGRTISVIPLWKWMI